MQPVVSNIDIWTCRWLCSWCYTTSYQ